MAYFSNSTDGMAFDDQCQICKYGEEPCPIALVQNLYNYDVCNNEVARKILDSLVKDNGTCEFFRQFQKDLKIDARQKSLF